VVAVDITFRCSNDSVFPHKHYADGKDKEDRTCRDIEKQGIKVKGVY
jgi:hypothetical protein